MSSRRVRNQISISLTVMSLLFISNVVRAEDILEKGDVKYLGWKISDEKFRTCNGEEINPKDGKLVSTTRKCSKDQRIEENKRRKKEGLPLLIIDDTSQLTKTQEEVMSIFTSYENALSGRDASVLKALLADNFTSVSRDGLIINKSDFLSLFKQPDSLAAERLEMIDASESSVRVYGNTAIITALVNLREKLPTNQEVIQRAVYTVVVVKNKDQWQIVSTQGSRVAPRILLNERPKQ